MNHHEELLALLSGTKSNRVPFFSGLIHVTIDGLAQERLSFHEVHHDPQKMAKAAASTFRLTGIPSAALPLDLCVPAEALGAELNYYSETEDRFPQPKKSLFASTKYLNEGYLQSADFINRGRIPLICTAMQLLKEDVGNDVVISGVIPGPYTLLLYLTEPGGLFVEMKREPIFVLDALLHLSSFLSQIGNAYHNAGADFITIHEMGGSPGFIGPSKFEQFVFPAVKQLILELQKPTVLSVCGNTNKSMHLLAQTDADAISVDQTNDLAASRDALPATLLFGNIDPLQTLALGTEQDIHDATEAALHANVDAVWPGCDLVLQTPTKNLQTFIE